ncbi:hypothetical protein Y710_16390 [Gordonia sp. QH-12]|uniref:hypothetical protein n=1 Tax=Gordonia TaxID=2053 RepID=UPI0007839F20|nr:MULTISPECIES: hypothetical protein [Gordonia]KXT55927.1 hypothetical protein Y710_16390 [Gordonia sp. QH-12]WFN94172.1 hypothetical protein P5P27_06395 [Gordonia sihwensis]WFN94233.1 hypothetical protein P5P27_06705 [Gordonia sihwensis]
MSNDPLADVIAYVEPRLPDCYVADEAPPETAFEKRLPVVLIRDLPGGVDDMPWQSAFGALTEVFAFDVDVYAARREDCRAISRKLRRILAAMILDPNVAARSVTEVVGFARRPDHNKYIVRDGAEYELRRPYVT